MDAVIVFLDSSRAILEPLFAAAFALFGIGIIVNLLRPFQSGIKRSLRVAVIGLPRAGKTTLIASIFDRIMSGKFARYVTVNGEETVNRVTEYLGMLKAGHDLPPTLDDDVFAFRFNYTRKVFGLVPLKYDVEVADFPGEYSEEITSAEFGIARPAGFYRKEFFSWIVRADRYVFVVDVQEYYIGSSSERAAYVLRITQGIKKAVLLLKQELLDDSVFERPCALVFAKSDALYAQTDVTSLQKDNSNLFEQEGADPAAGPDFNEEKLSLAFSELEQFLKNNFRRTHVIFHSSKDSSGRFTKASDALIRLMSPL